MLGWFKKKKANGKETTSPRVDPKEPAGLPSGNLEGNGVGTAGSKTTEAARPPELETSPAAAREEKKSGLFSRLKKSLGKTRENLVQRLDSVFLGKKYIDADLLDELEEILITADLGVQTVQDLLEKTRSNLKRKELMEPALLYEALKKQIYGYLHAADKSAELAMPADAPLIIMVLGVNGVGKTTTIGKLAYKFKKSGRKVLLVAADTFRAAAIDQLKIWAQRIEVEICAQTPGADPSAVVYDAMDFAKNRDFEVIIIDTAGRLHTKVNLMEELKKLKRVMGKKIAGAPHEVMLVLDATTGQNAISQAREFNKAVEITGLTLTKLDGTAKGGIVVNISRELNIPIRFIGIGEKMEDLRDFDPKEFTEALFSK
jgi:fused signal recognition particle receptor